MKEKKHHVYTLWHIILGSYLGGPLAATYFIAQNFKALGDEQSSKKTWQIGIAITILIFAGLFFLPVDFVDTQPNSLVPILYTVLVAVYFNKKQKDQVEEYIKNGNPKASGWKTFGMSLLWLVVTILGVVSSALIVDQIVMFF